MIAVLQRVSSASVRVGGEEISRIGRGLLVLVASLRGDRDEDADALAEKVALYRVFEDDEGHMNRSVRDVGGSVLVVSQFTLAADGSKGRRPSFDRAAPPEEAVLRVGRFAEALRERGLDVAQGRFGAHSEVQLVNDGPATFCLQRPAAGE